MVLQEARRICDRPLNIWKGLILLVLCLTLFCTGGLACSPGRIGARRRSIRKLTPLVFKQHVPNVPENSLGASGPPEERIRRGDARFKELVLNYNADIVYKDKRGTGADRVMTQRCKEKLDQLAISVMNQWPSVRLRVTEGFDEEGYHAPESLHYSGRAVDITTSDRDISKYGMLARLAVEAGFDWVYFESRSHIHCSVKKESTVPSKSIGCFHGSSTVVTRNGWKKMADVIEGDEILSDFQENGLLSYSKVIAFLHRNEDMDVTFVRLETDSGRVLHLTQTHLVFKWVDHKLESIYAILLEEGDLVYTRSKTGNFTLTEIKHVTLLTMKGVYAPLTEFGTIVVDDIWVSCYAEVADHHLAHAIFTPVRFLHVIETLSVHSVTLVWDNLNFLRLSAPEWLVTKPAIQSDNETEESLHWYAKLLCWIRCKEKLDQLAISVMNQWPSVRLRVTEGFDEEGYHAPESLHYSGRAVDITTSDRDISKYGMLARLAVEAGFDWVYFESRSHIHCSVKKESTVPSKSIGCFHGSSTVVTRNGWKKMADVIEGDEILSDFQENGLLSYSKVIAFLHRNEDMDVTFVRLETDSGRVLHLTQTHLVFKWVDHKLESIYAILLEEGDLVYTRSKTGNFTLTEIKHVTLLTMKGVYAPLTEFGTIVVDDIWVSCYAEVADHHLAHAIFTPVRFLHVIETLSVHSVTLVWDNLNFLRLSAPEWLVTKPAIQSDNETEESLHWYAKLLCWIVSPYFIACE